MLEKGKTLGPGLEKCLADLRAEDVLLDWRLDRLGRSMAHLVRPIEQLPSAHDRSRSRSRRLPTVATDPAVGAAHNKKVSRRLRRHHRPPGLRPSRAPAYDVDLRNRDGLSKSPAYVLRYGKRRRPEATAVAFFRPSLPLS